MIPYIVVFIISIGLFYLSDKVVKKQKKPLIFIGIALLSLLAGLRAESIGTDTSVYLLPVFEAAKKCHSMSEYLNSSFHAFSWTTDYIKNLEPLFILIVLFVTKLTQSIYCVQTILELCVILPLYLAVKKRNSVSLWVAMFVFCMAFYNPSMNMMRQSIAMSLGILGFEYWREKEKKQSIICVVIAFLFHRTSLLLLLIYFLYDYNVNGNIITYRKKKRSQRNEISRLLISISVGVIGIVLASTIVSVLPAVGFGKYVSYVTGKLTFMPNQLIIRVPQIVLLIWCYKYLKKKKIEANFFLVMQIYAILLAQFTSVSEYGGRIALYFSIFDILMVALAMDALKKVKSRIFIRPVIIGYFMFYWWYYYVLTGAHQTVPYVFLY